MDNKASEEFIQNQEKIYRESFEAKVPELLERGILPDPALIESHGGFLLYCKHGKILSQKFAAAAESIAAIVPCVAYTPELMHTTMCTVGVKPGRVIKPENPEDKDILEKFASAKDFPIGWIDTVPNPGFTYSGFLINRTTVVARGTPDAAFGIIGDIIIHRLKKSGLEVRSAWGGHATVARFTQPITDRKVLERLVRIVGELEAPGKNYPEKTFPEYGFFQCTPDSFNLTPCG